jgi:hypothetical protein
MAEKETISKSNGLVEALKKMHSAQAIEKKDFALQDLFDSKTKEVTIDVAGFASKFVPKYHKEDNPGFHTMIYLADGQKTGAFASSLWYFAQFFYEKAGLNPEDKFNKLMFDGSLKVKVTLIPLENGSKKTYNFEIVEGEINGVERIGQGGSGIMLPEATIATTEEAAQ